MPVMDDENYGPVCILPLLEAGSLKHPDLVQDILEEAETQGHEPTEMTHTGEPVVYFSGVYKYIKGGDPEDRTLVDSVFFMKVKEKQRAKYLGTVEYHYKGRDLGSYPDAQSYGITPPEVFAKIIENTINRNR